jgi:hypothetical protein
MAAKTFSPAGDNTDLSEAEWELLKPLIYPADTKRSRGRLLDPDSARVCLLSRLHPLSAHDRLTVDAAAQGLFAQKHRARRIGKMAASSWPRPAASTAPMFGRTEPPNKRQHPQLREAVFKTAKLGLERKRGMCAATKGGFAVEKSC